MVSFGVLNSAVLAVYLIGMVLIGLRFARRQQSSEDYFLAGRNMPWLPAGMSI
jgi:SSS family solute:Na+ symporter